MGHKRKRREEGKERFNLPPITQKPAPAPTSIFQFGDGPKDELGSEGKRRKVDSDERGSRKRAEEEGRRSGGPARKKKKGMEVADDTPKQFARLMAWRNEGRGLRKGLDDGVVGEGKKKRVGKSERSNEGTRLGVAQDVKEKKNGATEGKAIAMKGAGASTGQGPEDSKSKAGNDSSNSTINSGRTSNKPPASALDPSTAAPLKILPGERLSDFSLRVDQSLPLSSIPKYSTKETLRIPGLKSKQNLTKHNKKLLRMQQLWREEDKKIKERKAAQEEDGDMEDKREEQVLLWRDVEGVRGGKKGKKRKGERDGDVDIWRGLERKREGDMKRPVLTAGEAVKEPPKLGKVKNIFKDMGEMR